MPGPEVKPAEPELMDVVQETVSSSALAAVNQAEVDTQVATAKRYPRDLTKFKRDAIEMVTFDKATARTMWYTLPPRAGGDEKPRSIEGPGVRLAEVVSTCWGNSAFLVRTVIEDDYVVAQGVGIDWERNNRYVVEVRRGIRTKTGKRYGTDMIRVTSMAAAAIAFREAVFKVVPRTWVRQLWREAQKCALGGDDAKTMPQRREEAFKAFTSETGCSNAEVLKVLGRKGMDSVSLDDLYTLHGYITSMEEGNLTWETLRENTAAAPQYKPPVPGKKGAAAETEDGEGDGGGDSARAGQAPASAGTEPASSSSAATPSPDDTFLALYADQEEEERKQIWWKRFGLDPDDPKTLSAQDLQENLNLLDRCEKANSPVLKEAMGYYREARKAASKR